MRIEVKGRNVVVGDELKDRIQKRCEKVARQVSPLAVMDVELSEERNPSIKEGQIAECTLRLKGVTLRSRGGMVHSRARGRARRSLPRGPADRCAERGRHRPAGQAPPREAPRPPRRPCRGSPSGNLALDPVNSP